MTLHTPLSPREQRIVELHREGLENRFIAERLGCSRGTVASALMKARHQGVLVKGAKQ